MSYSIHQHSSCRICGSTELSRFLHIEAVPMTDGFVKPSEAGSEFMAPLDLYCCTICHIAQTLHDVEVIEYYRDYRYTVSHSSFAREYMRRLAECVEELVELGPEDHVIEVGSGDGHQLSYFQAQGANVLGFEPAHDLVAISEQSGVRVIEGLFDADSVGNIPSEYQNAQVVLLTHTFDHLPDPVPFLDIVRQILDAERGVLVIEVHDLAEIIARKEIGLFAHEHTIYTHAASIQRLLNRSGFKMIGVNMVPDDHRRGNSLLVAAALDSSRYTPLAEHEVTELSDSDDCQVLAEFGQQIEQAYGRFREHILSERAVGKRFAAYGVGGRGVLTLCLAKFTHEDIEFVCDRNESFHGLVTPGTHIPVVPPQHLLADPVDEVIVFSYGYINEIREQLSEYLALGGKLTPFIEYLA